MFGRRVAKKVVAKAFPELANVGPRLRAIEAAFWVMATNSKYEDDESSFNKQAKRREITTRILLAMAPSNIIETGTFLGNTTGYLAKFGVPVYSSEISPPLFVAAKQRLSSFSNINLVLCDSRTFLTGLVSERINILPSFFYLDAHWLDDLPLLDELNLIDENWENWIVLIDDFKVPNDPGYGYDNYGARKTLNYSYIKRFVERRSLAVFFPTIPSVEESGAKRGYVFLARGTDNVRILSSCEMLGRYPWRSVETNNESEPNKDTAVAATRAESNS